MDGSVPAEHVGDGNQQRVGVDLHKGLVLNVNPKGVEDEGGETVLVDAAPGGQLLMA